MAIRVKTESERGCGRRKPGGFYLVGEGPGFPCCKMPSPLPVCPYCNSGVHQQRGFQWVDASVLQQKPCENKEEEAALCPFKTIKGQVGIMWVGVQAYPTADHFTREAQRQGVSKRIASGQIPKGLKVGETWIFLAHPKAISVIEEGGDIKHGPGIFYAFKPKAIEYVIRGDETKEYIENLEKRGIQPVKIIPDTEAQTKIEEFLRK